MPRPRTITDEQILEAAREVFMERGLEATTAEIAERAGVSEGSIFKRFATKDHLFMRSMSFDEDGRPPWAKTVDEVDPEQGDVAQQLERIGQALFEFFHTMIPRISIMMSKNMGSSLHEKFPMFATPESPPVKGVRVLAGYLQRAKRAGKIRPEIDTEIAARMFLAAMHFHDFSEHAGINTVMPMPHGTYIRGVVRNLLVGIVDDP
ncbi:MAG: TetR/AcrR family transcriptional regulator [Myxococcota bacterium]